jgi:hypothetical protein
LKRSWEYFVKAMRMAIEAVEVIRELFHSIRGPERSYFEA